MEQWLGDWETVGDIGKDLSNLNWNQIDKKPAAWRSGDIQKWNSKYKDIRSREEYGMMEA